MEIFIIEKHAQDESLAGNILLAENTSIKEFRKLFDETAIHAWHTARVEYSDQKEIFGETMKVISEALGDIEKATSQDEITAIRERIKTVRQNVILFNKYIDKEQLSNNAAVSARIAREVFEHHEAVVRSRARVAKDYGGFIYSEIAVDRGRVGDNVYAVHSWRTAEEERNKRIKEAKNKGVTTQAKSRSKEGGFFDAVKSLMQTKRQAS